MAKDSLIDPYKLKPAHIILGTAHNAKNYTHQIGQIYRKTTFKLAATAFTSHHKTIGIAQSTKYKP